jgi:predicted small secreted protein
MIDRKTLPKDEKVGGPIFEELAFEYFTKKYNISKEDLLKLLEEKQNANSTIPISILKTSKLSSLEAIVKFLRENRNLSYNIIGGYLKRNPRTLAVTYAVAHRKMPEKFSTDIDTDTKRIPFTSFSKDLSVLECICAYLKSQNHSYADIARMIGKDQRTVWTVCKRAENKSGKDIGKNKIDDGRKAR